MEPTSLHASATAFGDGTHPTTAGMLAALHAIDPAAFTPRNACDIGCGSGILSLAIAQRFGCPVIATDILADAVATTRHNAAASGYTAQITALQSDGFAHPTLAAQAPFDLIVMNILAEPLLALAIPATAHLAGDGVLIMSGILHWQEAPILSAYEALGLERSFRIQIGDWVTLVWQKG